MIAYASPPELAVLAGTVLAVGAFLVFAFWPEIRDHLRSEDRSRMTLPPRCDRDPVPNFRTLGPRPFDWSIDDPTLGRVIRGEAFVGPLVIDETFPHGPAWEHLGFIANVDPAAFVFVAPLGTPAPGTEEARGEPRASRASTSGPRE